VACLGAQCWKNWTAMSVPRSAGLPLKHGAQTLIHFWKLQAHFPFCMIFFWMFQKKKVNIFFFSLSTFEGGTPFPQNLDLKTFKVLNVFISYRNLSLRQMTGFAERFYETKAPKIWLFVEGHEKIITKKIHSWQNPA